MKGRSTSCGAARCHIEVLSGCPRCVRRKSWSFRDECRDVVAARGASGDRRSRRQTEQDMHWPAVKMTDMVIGVDLHTVLIVVPVPMTPHPYFGVIFLWMTPAFPKVDTLINKMPACS